MFHLFTHAFFMALLFLGAGAVINGMHHEQDMRKMGALWRYLPVTYAVMTVGTLAITGVGLPIPGFEVGLAGFYSKDGIIEAAFAAAQHSGDSVAYFAFVIGLTAAGLTAFYSWRLVFMTFHGHPKWEHAGETAHGDDHASPAQIETHTQPLPDAGHGAHAHGKPHEAPWVMLGPLIVLALGAVAAGFIWHEAFIGPERAEFWRGAIFTAASNHVLDHEGGMPVWVVWAPLVVTAIGFASAWYVYIRREGLGAQIAAQRGALWTFLYNKWFFDELYEATFVRGAKALGDLFWKVGDQKVIDGLGPDGVSAASYAAGRRVFSRAQTGYVYHYAFVMLIGVAALVAYAMWAFT
jgi:NADH-quinone oxidoreductase subunit L